MPKLKTLSGADVVKIFCAFGFVVVAQKGSHVKLRRKLFNGATQTLTVPNHPELDKGTLKAIYRQALRFISEGEIQGQFYSE